MMLPPVQMAISAFTQLAGVAVGLGLQIGLLGVRMALLAVSFAASAGAAFLALSPIGMIGVALAAAAIGVLAFIGYTQGLGAVFSALRDVASGFLAVAVPIGSAFLAIGAVIAGVAVVIGQFVMELARVIAPLVGFRNEFEVLGAAIALVVSAYLVSSLIGGLARVITALGLASTATAAFSAKAVLGFGAIGVAILALAPHFDTLVGWLDAIDEKLTGGMIGDALAGKGDTVAAGGLLAAIAGRGLFAKGAAGLGGLLMSPPVAGGLAAAGLAGFAGYAGYQYLDVIRNGMPLPDNVNDYYGSEMGHIAATDYQYHDGNRVRSMQMLSTALQDSQRFYGYVPNDWQQQAITTGFSEDEIRTVLAQMPHRRVTTQGEAGSIAMNLVQDYAEMAAASGGGLKTSAQDQIDQAQKDSASLADKLWKSVEDSLAMFGLGDGAIDGVNDMLGKLGIHPDEGDWEPDEFFGMTTHGKYSDMLKKMLGPEASKWLEDTWKFDAFEDLKKEIGDAAAIQHYQDYEAMGLGFPTAPGALGEGGLEGMLGLDPEEVDKYIQELNDFNQELVDATMNLDLPTAIRGALGTQFQSMSLGEGMGMWGDLFSEIIPEEAEWSNIFEGIADVVGMGDVGNILGQNLHEELANSDGFMRWISEMGVTFDDAIANIPKFMHAEELMPQAFQGVLKGINLMGPEMYSALDGLASQMGVAGIEWAELSQYAIGKAMAGQEWNLVDYVAEAWGMAVEDVETLFAENGIDADAISSGMFESLDQAIASSFGAVNLISPQTYENLRGWTSDFSSKILQVTQEEFNSIAEGERIALSNAGFVFMIEEDDVEVDTEGGKAGIEKAWEGWSDYIQGRYGQGAEPLDIRQPVNFTLEVEGGTPKIEGGGKTPGSSPFTPYIPPDLLNPPVIQSVQKINVTTEVTSTGRADKNWSPIAAELGLASKNNTAGSGGVYTFPPISAVQEIQVATTSNSEQALQEAQANLDLIKDTIAGFSLPTVTLTQEVAIDYVIPGAAQGFPMGTDFGRGAAAATSGITMPVTVQVDRSQLDSLLTSLSSIQPTTVTVTDSSESARVNLLTIMTRLTSINAASSIAKVTDTTEAARVNLLTILTRLTSINAASSVAKVTDTTESARVNLLTIINRMTSINAAAPVAKVTDSTESARVNLLTIINRLDTIDGYDAHATATVSVSGLSTANALLSTLRSLDGYHASSSASFTQTTILQTIDAGTSFFGFAEGGIHKGPSPYAVVGEEGPELIKMPFGTRIYSHDESMRMLSQWASSPVRTESYANAIKSSGGSVDAASDQAAGDVNITFNGDMHFESTADVDYLVDRISGLLGRRFENAQRIMPTDGGRR
jgi:hypothetical protein